MNTDKAYNKTFDWILSHGPAILMGIVVLFVGFWVIGFLKKGLRKALHLRSIDPSLQPFFFSLIVTALYVVLVLSVMQIVGLEITLFATLIGAMGVAAGLALSGTLQNFAGGVLILLLKPFKVGDNIIAQGFDGNVTAIQLFYTKVTLFDNRQVIIPNGKLSNEVILNVTKLGTRRLEIKLSLSYYADIDQAREAVADAIKRNENVLAEPAPRIGIINLEEGSMQMTIRVWVNDDVYLGTKLALNEEIVKSIRKTGIIQPVDQDLFVVMKDEKKATPPVE